MGVIGVAWTAILSAYSAVEYTFSVLFTSYMPVVSASEAEQRLSDINEELSVKRKRLQRVSEESVLGKDGKDGLLYRFMSSFSDSLSASESESMLACLTRSVGGGNFTTGRVSTVCLSGC